MAYIKQKCDFCDAEAKWDAKTVYGPWAFLCDTHLAKLGVQDPHMRTPLQRPVITKKTCSICGQDKPIDQFYKYTDHGGTERYRTECIECNLTAKKRRRFKK